MVRLSMLKLPFLTQQLHRTQVPRYPRTWIPGYLGNYPGTDGNIGVGGMRRQLGKFSQLRGTPRSLP